jgi:hypothetical protein
VTYWDQFGWKDNFTRPAFTAHQWKYARTGGRGNVQTPQLMVHRQAAILGSRKAEVDATIAKNRPAISAPAINVTAGLIAIGAGKASGASKIWLVDDDPRNSPADPYRRK